MFKIMTAQKRVLVSNGLTPTISKSLSAIVKEVEKSEANKGILAKFGVMFEKTKNAIIIL